MAAARFAELRALRAAGKTRLSTYQVQEEEKLYEEVDEEDYKKVVRERLNQDDFVIDDNGEGYVDDGREDWLHDRRGESESEEEIPVKGKAAKRKREEDREKQEKMNQGISKYFSAGNAVAQPKPKPVATAEDAAFMADLLGEVDNNIPIRRVSLKVKAVKSEERRKVRILSPPLPDAKPGTARHSESDCLPATPPVENSFDDGDGMYGRFDDDMPMDDPHLPSSPVAKAVQRKSNAPVKVKGEEDEEEDLLEVAQAVGHAGIPSISVNKSGSRPPPKIKKPDYPTPDSSSPPRAADAIDPSTWNDVNTKLNVVSSPAPETVHFGKLRPEDALEEDGTLRMFWFDYTEVNGSLCLFGKVKNKSNGGYASCFVKVDNILRKVYFLPREYRQRHGRDTSEEVEMTDVYQEVDEIMTRNRVGMHKIKPCTRKYAFELPDVPKEADYLKLLYSYDRMALPMDIQGETFSHAFGTNTSLFEQFVLWKNVMGPCWLKIEDGDFSSVNNASWCKLEIAVSKPNSISVLGESENMEAPPLTLMSIALRTVMNTKENTQEILVASARIYENVSLNDTTPPEKLPCQTFTVIRPVGQSFPIGFEQECKRQRGGIRTEKSEQALLSSFLAKLQNVDPDVLIGHQLEGVDYSVILSRMKDRKTPSWHRIGRMRRSAWPNNFGKGGGSFFEERKIVSGRLLCDLANDLGKSLMTKCQSWSLTEMCEIILGEGNKRREVDNDVALKTWATTADGLMNYLKHCETDTYFIAAIALKVQMLPLTKVLTNLAGNSWARTLSGTRAERNEYILLHEFHRNKYIVPDKVFGRGNAKKPDENPDGEEGADIKKKDKYKGGLVFEPEKGLYDKFILVMDFNSLYPSIIQEYNICFTTVHRSGLDKDEDKVPEVPEDQQPGVLPRLIATLVSRRRQVKSLMKDKRATPEQLAQWDIKQQALKLTANSMYGCLGYTRSRFYARPLAMLTTFKGREILSSTKELAESTQLQVIYGDTDSVMINTNADNVEAALKVGKEFKKAVNDRYKLLEIDIDNVFRRLLLHAKKKYAAINLVEMDGKYIERLEVKGLDMRRREYCALSKDISSKLLNEILSGEESEVVVTKVHDYLRDVSEKMKEGSIPTHKYIIYTKLGKHPREYPNADSMPQVQVALREMSRGKTVRANDVMSYIVTGDSSKTSEPAAKRAYTIQDVNKTGSELKPDVEWYLIKQILPPVERLCAPIDGTDSVRLAECLGLDTTKYKISSSSASDQKEIHPLESQIDDEVRFKDAVRFSLRCRFCKGSVNFDGPVNTPDVCTPSGIACPNTECQRILPVISIVAQLESQIRQQTARYYEAWLVCDDTSCGNRTRQISVYGHRCLGPKAHGHGCLGRMSYEYTDKMLYNQLLYYRSLFDVDKAKEKAKADLKGGDRERITIAMDHNRERFGTLVGVVDKYLAKCGRQWVAMDSLFGFALT